jgi:Rrf2 family protein
MKGIGKQTDYAARILLHLACLGDDVQIPMNEITAKRLIPPPYARRIVARLAGAGFLKTSRGMGGGIRLARPASEITLLEVVSVFEGGMILNRCVDDPEACPFDNICPVQKAWTNATRQLEEHLATVRFDLLAKDAKKLGSKTGYMIQIESDSETTGTK